MIKDFLIFVFCMCLFFSCSFRDVRSFGKVDLAISSIQCLHRCEVKVVGEIPDNLVNLFCVRVREFVNKLEFEGVFDFGVLSFYDDKSDDFVFSVYHLPPSGCCRYV